MDGLIVDAAGTFFALLALLVSVAVVGLVTVAALARRAGPGWGPVRVVQTYGLGATSAVIGVATLGSLFYSEVVGFVPCELCWAQRIFAYPLATILTVALVRDLRGAGDTRAVWVSAVPLAALGLPISVYHWLVEHTPVTTGVCDVANPCSIIWVERFGFVSLPYMAGSAFAFVLGVALVIRSADRQPNGTTPSDHSAEPTDGQAAARGAAWR